ncbi:hypothetical protein [Cobetia sp. 29-18-1]|uniref:hypothetical protein n=1 Tax=Cobetia sp. 29-18-1 TaxID=3040018 RepID=UPI00244B2468|nr:hypothetical protein [Cobetia sp. 29-18-1]MDH2299796.1 hypothetical protein [Cobetia sp. 29-18-1]
MANTHAEYLRQLAALQSQADDWHNIISAAEEVERLERARAAEMSARRSSQSHAQKVTAASADYQSKAESALASADSLIETLRLERDAMAALAEERQRFIINGVEHGMITLPDSDIDDAAHDTYQRCEMTTGHAAAALATQRAKRQSHLEEASEA